MTKKQKVTAVALSLQVFGYGLLVYFAGLGIASGVFMIEWARNVDKMG